MQQNILTGFIQSLKSSHLLMVLSGLFVLDLFWFDPIPFLDEAFLGITTLLVARWKMRRLPPPEEEKPPTKNVTPAAGPPPHDPPNTP